MVMAICSCIIYIYCVVFVYPVQPQSVTISLVNATAVTISWNVNIIFSILIQHTSYCVSTGVIMSNNEIVLPPGVAFTEVDIENDLTLDDMKENIQHKFTLQYIIVTTQGTPEYGAMTMQIFSFGMYYHVYKYAINKYNGNFTDKMYLQIQFGPIDYCLSWGVSQLYSLACDYECAVIASTQK